jgi:hypothetical protein
LEAAHTGLDLEVVLHPWSQPLCALTGRPSCALPASLRSTPQVSTQFFTLQVVIVFFASFITGSLLNQLALLLTSPQQVLTILGTGGCARVVAPVPEAL